MTPAIIGPWNNVLAVEESRWRREFLDGVLWTDQTSFEDPREG
jgi:hypothetical protein